jgi:ubiquinone/menaquinone biosynthesis C-methylase UbiE
MKPDPASERAKRITAIVEKNFDESSQDYCELEAKTNFFTDLARDLAMYCGIGPGMTVLDVGCGTGASSFVLLESVSPSGIVIGTDISAKMLAEADVQRKKLRATNVQFVKCEAQKVWGTVDLVFDAALFNASIFLMPNTAFVLDSVRNVLKPEGKLGFNYIEYDLRPDGEYYKMLDEANRPEMGPLLWQKDDLVRILGQVGLLKVKSDVSKYRRPLDVVKGFYMVPAMGASLFPKLDVAQRKQKVSAIFDDLASKGVTEITQQWVRYYCVRT